MEQFKPNQKSKRNKTEKLPKKGLPVDRRMFMTGVVGTAMTAAIGGGAIANKEIQNYLANSEKERLERQYQKRTYDASQFQLSGFDVGQKAHKSLFAYYTGYSGKLPDTLHISFKKNLDELRRLKADFLKKHSRKASASEREAEALLKQDKMDNTYDPDHADQTSLSELLTDADGIARSVVESTDWSTIQKKYSFSNATLERLRRLASRIQGRTLLAYSMTEIMPSHNGAKNARMYDFLLQTAGKEFIREIPSIGDTEEECEGPFQLTDRVQEHIPSLGPAGIRSLSTFEAHIQAACELTIYNLTRAIQKTEDWPNLTEIGQELFDTLHGSELAAFLAAAHHRPKSAEAVLHAWLTDKDARNHAFSEYAGRNSEREDATLNNAERDRSMVVPYIAKTKSNFEALEAMMRTDEEEAAPRN